MLGPGYVRIAVVAVSTVLLGGCARGTPAPPPQVLYSVQQAAAADGDPSPSLPVQWTALTISRAETTLNLGSTPAVPSDAPVWVAQLRGTFQCFSCSGGPPPGSIPTGTVIVLLIEQPGPEAGESAGEVLETSLGPTMWDLSRLGRVHTFRI